MIETFAQLGVRRPRIPNDIQIALIKRALFVTEGNVRQAALLLDEDKTNLRRRMKRLGIDWRSFRTAA